MKKRTTSILAATALALGLSVGAAGSAQAVLRVTVHVPDAAAVDRVRLDRVVTIVKPAHVAHVIDVVEDSDADMS